MTQALDDCATAAEQEEVKKHQIFGIEFDENVYGLATTNMLIHSDGNSNIRQGSCFALADWIKEAKPNMNLNFSNWMPFKLSDIFHLYNGAGITKEEIECNPGDFVAVQSGEENNGCIGKIDKAYCETFLYNGT